MRRSSKRKADPLDSSSLTSSADPPAGKAKSRRTEQIDSLFDSYANRSSGIIDPDGIEALCSDMEVKHTDVRILLLAWKMKAQKQGYFTREEWWTGLKTLRVDTLSKLKKALTKLENEIGAAETFGDFYSYTFRYCLTEENKKSIDIESICELLNLVLRSQFCSKVDSFIEYLKIQRDYKVINWDQWMSVLRFFKEVFTIISTDESNLFLTNL